MSESASATNAFDKKRQAATIAQTREAAVSIRYSDTVLAYTILRLSFGANIMFHGVTRLFNRPGFLAYLNHYFEKTPLIPMAILPTVGAVLPWVETTLGLLLLLGLATRFSLIAGALVMAFLVVGTNLAQDWTVAGLQLIYCFIYYYLLAHREQNLLSVDGFWGGRSRPGF
jgi:thiosulfate dehydrogenase [quinone] large subunit